jgi:hypothetical protein
VPAPRDKVPRLFTFQRKRANRRILNEDDVVALLRQYGEVQVRHDYTGYLMYCHVNACKHWAP